MEVQKKLKRFGPWVAVAAIAFLWGIAAGEYHVFPYQQFRMAKNLVDGEDGARDPDVYIGSPKAVAVGVGDPLWGTRADVAMVGDSITAQGRWHEMFPGISIVNRGVGGDTVGGVRERLPSITAVEADTYFLMIGTNDALMDNPDAAILDHYAAVLDGLQADGAEVYVHPILQCGAIAQCTPAVHDKIDRLNAQITKLARQKNAQIIDLNPALTDEDGLKPELTWDGLHLNSEGFRLWREAIGDEVEQSGKSRR
tara:strand:+ start:954 stop:1715 length:762 start_codon:yes stop_codon:yes gene_type:complete